MPESKVVADAIYDLALKMRAKGIKEAEIAEAGGMRRQSLNARGVSVRQEGGRSLRLGFGFAVIKAAFEYGFAEEAIAILSGKEVQPPPRVLMPNVPDITLEELKAIKGIAQTLRVSELPDDLLQSVVKLLRAPEP